MKAVTKTRLNWIDYARGIAIILVVYRHTFEGLKRATALSDAGVDINSYIFLEHANIFFFSFRMPLFFIVSGFFIGNSLAKRGLPQLVSNKAKTILYPYVLWGIIHISIQIIFSAYINSKKTAFDYTYLLYQPREVEQFWYLYALFNVSVLYALLKSKTSFTYIQQIALGLFFFLLSALFSQYEIELGFINDIFHYYIFLALGDAVGKSILSGRLRGFFASPKAFFILLIPFLLSQYYFLNANILHTSVSPKYLYVEYYQPMVYLLIALTGCAFIISVSSLLDKFDIVQWLRKLGKYSLQIYVMHVIVFAAVRVLLIKFLHVYNIYILMFTCMTAGIVIPVLFSRITERLGWYFLFSLEKNNPKK